MINVRASHDNGMQIIYQSSIDFDAIPKKALAYTMYTAPL